MIPSINEQNYPKSPLQEIQNLVNNLNIQEEVQLKNQQQQQDTQNPKQLINSQEQENLQECSICFEIIDINNIQSFHPINQCQHTFHTECLYKHIEQSRNPEMEISCPQENCQININKQNWIEIVYNKSIKHNQNPLFQEIKHDHPELQPQICFNYSCIRPFYVQKQFKPGKVKFLETCKKCKRQQCFKCKKSHPGIANCEDIKNAKPWKCFNNSCKVDFFFLPTENQSTIQCYKCKRNHCSKCGFHSHGGIKCEDLEINDPIFQFMLKEKYQICQQCHLWVQKISGCNHMTCVCKFQFCYHCGSKYKTCKC